MDSYCGVVLSLVMLVAGQGMADRATLCILPVAAVAAVADEKELLEAPV